MRSIFPLHRDRKVPSHRIHLNNDRAICVPPQHISGEKKKKLYKQLEEMLADGVVEASRSSFSFLVVMVAKKGKEGRRFCIGYRKLKQVTITEPSPLLSADHTRDSQRPEHSQSVLSTEP